MLDWIEGGFAWGRATFGLWGLCLLIAINVMMGLVYIFENDAKTVAGAGGWMTFAAMFVIPPVFLVGLFISIFATGFIASFWVLVTGIASAALWAWAIGRL